MEPAYISQLVWIPYRYYTPADAHRVLKELTVVPMSFEGKPRQPIAYWRKDDERSMVGMPVDYGIRELYRLGIPDSATVEDISEGFPVSFPGKPTPRNEAQGEFFANTIEALQDNYTVMATAPTGTGKTVNVLNAVATLGKTALIVVDTIVIAGQWRDEIKKHLGLREEEIGTIQGSTVEYQGKRITVAVIHNLVQKIHPSEFYRYFGFVAWDEGQILGAESFSASMGLFPARHRITVTATPDRRDGCFRMVTDHFGEPRVVANQVALPCEIRILRYNRHHSNRIPSAILLNQLTLDEERNRLIVGIILQEWNEGRDFLCVSDRIEHLQHLMEWCKASGVPGEQMGLFTRTYIDEEGKEHTNKKPYLDWCKREAKIIFATYQMFEKAVDVPRLSSGCDATPRSAAMQLLGRIRRVCPGKPSPRWWTILDSGVFKLSRKFKSRLKDYDSDPHITLNYI